MILVVAGFRVAQDPTDAELVINGDDHAGRSRTQAADWEEVPLLKQSQLLRVDESGGTQKMILLSVVEIRRSQPNHARRLWGMLMKILS